MSTSSNHTCPIPTTHDKFNEAHYFFHRTMDVYHEPDPFRWNLNAFLQALRSVTFMLQSELKHQGGFDKWYQPWRERMKQDDLLKKFDKGRVTVVHIGMLQHKSYVQAGIFRGTVMKLAFDFPIDINMSSEVILKALIEGDTNIFPTFDMFKDFLDDTHPSIGEQLGVRRTWIVEDLGSKDDDVLLLCDHAWTRISQVVSAAHKFAGAEFPAIDVQHYISKIKILLETDLDPSLPQKWGWE